VVVEEEEFEAVLPSVVSEKKENSCLFSAKGYGTVIPSKTF